MYFKLEDSLKRTLYLPMFVGKFSSTIQTCRLNELITLSCPLVWMCVTVCVLSLWWTGGLSSVFSCPLWPWESTDGKYMDGNPKFARPTSSCTKQWPGLTQVSSCKWKKYLSFHRLDRGYAFPQGLDQLWWLIQINYQSLSAWCIILLKLNFYRSSQNIIFVFCHFFCQYPMNKISKCWLFYCSTRCESLHIKLSV